MTDKKLSGKRVLTFVGDIYEDLELWYPKLRLIEEGAQVVVAGEEANRVYAGKNGYPCTSDVAISDMHESQFDAVLLPGGFMPDRLRRLESVKKLIREFAHSKKCVAAICHGAQILTAAGVVRGKHCSCYPAVGPEVTACGGHYVEASGSFDNAHTDGHLVTAPAWPAHPAWMRQFLNVLGSKIHA